MYSVVVLMALSGGADTPAFGKGCDGCNGCDACHSSCSKRESLFSKLKNRGCHDSCSKCSKCHDSCSKCHDSCSKCSKCHDSCSCSKGGLFSRFKKNKGCDCSCSSACHSGCACSGAVIEEKKKEEKKEEKKGAINAPATIVVSLPADAQLTIDGNVTKSTTDRREFVSPELEAGMDYNYTLIAEVVRDGKTVTKTERVTVRAGETANVTIELPAPTVASK